MKYIKLILALAAITSCCSLYSCEWDPFDKCGGDGTLYNSFYFNILDKKTKANASQIYSYDSIKIYKENWNIIQDVQLGYNYIGFQIIEDTDRYVVDQLISRRYYLYFNHLDLDTIDIAFEKVFDKCHYQVIKQLKIMYNDSIYFDGPPPGGNLPGYINFLKKR